MTKFNNRKIAIDGITFDSKKEASRYLELMELQKAGQISDLELQKKYELIPSQRIDGKVVERAVTYIADFVYKENGETVVEDVKGYRNPQAAGYAKFAIKRKLMLYTHGIRVREV